MQTLTIARVGFSLSREAREKVDGDVSAQAISRFRARADAVSRSSASPATRCARSTCASNDPAGQPQPVLRAQAASRHVRRSPAGGSRQGHGDGYGQRQRADVSSRPQGRGRRTGWCRDGRSSVHGPGHAHVVLPASEHRNTPRSASCSGVENCCDGCFSASSRRLASSSRRLRHGGASTCFAPAASAPSRADGIDGDAVVAHSSAAALVRPTRPRLAAT